MNRKIALFAFNGEPMCFVHVLLTALDMKEKGYFIALEHLRHRRKSFGVKWHKMTAHMRCPPHEVRCGG